MQNDLFPHQTECSETVPSHLISIGLPLFWFCFSNNTPWVCAEDPRDHNFRKKSKGGLSLPFQSYQRLQSNSQSNKRLCFYSLAVMFSLHPSAQLFSSIDLKTVVPRKIFLWRIGTNYSWHRFLAEEGSY